MPSWDCRKNDIALLVANKELADYYDQVMKHTQHAKIAANWVIVELPGRVDKAEHEAG